MRTIEGKSTSRLSQQVMRIFAISLMVLLVSQIMPTADDWPTVRERYKDLYKHVYARLYYAWFVPTTYFVRTDGGTTVQCTGLADAAYDGSGSGEACAYNNTLSAIAAVTFGDTIKFKSTQTFDTPGIFQSFDLTNKGTPPTNTDADYITVTTTDPAGTPSALSGYPQFDVRITTAMAANMPRIRTIGSFPVFWINHSAKYWRIKGLNITTVPDANCIRLIGLGEDPPDSIAEFPHHIDIDQNWIHPPEEVGTPLDSSNIVRSAQNAIYLEGANITIRRNAIQGFVGREPGPGGTLTSAGHLMSTWAENVTVENNLIEAWTYSVFYGGGSRGIADPDFTATVSNCNSTSCTFSNTNGLIPGKPFTIGVYPRIVGGEPDFFWGTAYVDSVVGSVVTFDQPLCNSDNTGGNGNTCMPFDSNNVQQIPSDGAPARWEGFQVSDVTVRRNLLAHRDEWATQMGDNCGGKGYLELKSCHDCTFDANVFKGCTGPTITTRNQSGADPWYDLDNLVFSNNWFWNANSPFTAYLNDDGNRTDRTVNVTFINNLVTGEYADPNEFNYLRVISGNMSGGNGVNFIHNTVLVGRYRSFNATNVTLNVVNRDNIYRIGENICLIGETGFPMPTCWPSAVVTNNVLMNVDELYTNDVIDDRWTTPYPNNWLVNTVAAVGFVDAPSNLGPAGNYRLASNSQFKNTASDGTDPGVNFTTLVTALGFDPNGGEVPTPTPTPSPFITCKWSTNPRCQQP